MSQVGWPRLLPLSLRLNVAKAVLEQRRTLAVLLKDKQVARLLTRVRQLSIAEAPEPDEEFLQPEPLGSTAAAPLETYFAAVGSALAKKSAGDTSPAARALVEAVSSFCLRSICQDCSGAGNPGAVPMCRWTAASQVDDANTMESRGECLSAVREIFEYCRSTAAEAYEDVFGSKPRQVVFLATGHTQLDNVQLDLRIHGLTQEVGTALDKRRVSINFQVEDFDIHDYLSLLYVLFHECFVHAYCGVRIVGAGADESKAFHEGWMDCVSLVVLQNTLKVALPPSANHPVSLYSDEFLRQANRIRERRYDAGKSSSPADVVYWLAGEDALKTLQWLLARVLLELGIAAHEVASAVTTEISRLSIVINGSDIEHSVRANFVDTLSECYSYNNEDDRAKAVADKPQIVDVLARFHADRDVGALVQEVVAIGEG